jgi:hypothetical protein
VPLRLEDLKPDAQVKGLIGLEAVRIVSTHLMDEACDFVYKDGQGNLHSQILFRDREVDLELVSTGESGASKGMETSSGPTSGDLLRLLAIEGL